MAMPEYPFIGVEDYLVLDENSKDARYEYLDGELRMLAGGSVYHSLIAANVTGILYGLLGDGPCRVYNSDIRFQLATSRYVYPDITVSCDRRDQVQGDMIRYPLVVVEVLSPSTEITDRVKKLAYYQACPSIQEYIMIDSQKVLVDVYHRQTAKKWVQETLELTDTLVVESLQAQIPVQDIYRAIVFA